MGKNDPLAHKSAEYAPLYSIPHFSLTDTGFPASCCKNAFGTITYKQKREKLEMICIRIDSKYTVMRTLEDIVRYKIK